eukprot:6349165-Alexandrium_andersonii.AAC.1
MPLTSSGSKHPGPCDECCASVAHLCQVAQRLNILPHHAPHLSVWSSACLAACLALSLSGVPGPLAVPM